MYVRVYTRMEYTEKNTFVYFLYTLVDIYLEFFSLIKAVFHWFSKCPL